jgi:hypothetical protein
MLYVAFLAIVMMFLVNNSENCISRDEPFYEPPYKIQPILSKLAKRF